MTKAYLINPETRTVEPYEYTPGDGFPGIFATGLTLGWQWPSGDVLYVDDECLLRPAPACGGFQARSRADRQPFFDKGLIVGPEWETRQRWGCYDPLMSIERARDEIRFLDRDAALHWFRARAGTPAVTSTQGGFVTFSADWADILRTLEGRPGGYHPSQVPF